NAEPGSKDICDALNRGHWGRAMRGEVARSPDGQASARHRRRLSPSATWPTRRQLCWPGRVPGKAGRGGVGEGYAGAVARSMSPPPESTRPPFTVAEPDWANRDGRSRSVPVGVWKRRAASLL